MPAPRTVKVTVTLVSSGASAGPASIQIKVDPDRISLNGLGHGAGAHVHWDIVTADWTFTSSGIAIGNAGNRFSDKGRSNQNKRHTWQRDLPADQQEYKYTISVTNGKVVATWDPYIIND